MISLFISKPYFQSLLKGEFAMIRKLIIAVLTLILLMSCSLDMERQEVADKETVVSLCRNERDESVTTESSLSEPKPYVVSSFVSSEGNLIYVISIGQLRGVLLSPDSDVIRYLGVESFSTKKTIKETTAETISKAASTAVTDTIKTGTTSKISGSIGVKIEKIVEIKIEGSITSETSSTFANTRSQAITVAEQKTTSLDREISVAFCPEKFPAGHYRWGLEADLDCFLFVYKDKKGNLVISPYEIINKSYFSLSYSEDGYFAPVKEIADLSAEVILDLIEAEPSSSLSFSYDKKDSFGEILKVTPSLPSNVKVSSQTRSLPVASADCYSFNGWFSSAGKQIADNFGNILVDDLNGINILIARFSKIYNAKYISTPADLVAIAKNPSADYLLVNDIDLSGATWNPIPEFSGRLFGNGHKISNLSIKIENEADLSSCSFGLFAENSGEIVDLVMDKCGIDIREADEQGAGWIDLGIVCAKNSGLIRNVTVINSNIRVERNTSSAGFVAGRNLKTIDACTVKNNRIQSFGDIGGISGTAGVGSEICSCEVKDLNLQWYLTYENRSAGGIVGYSVGARIHSNVVESWKFQYRGSSGALHFIFFGHCNCSLKPSAGILVGHSKNSEIADNGFSIACVSSIEIVGDDSSYLNDAKANESLRWFRCEDKAIGYME